MELEGKEQAGAVQQRLGSAQPQQSNGQAERVDIFVRIRPTGRPSPRLVADQAESKLVRLFLRLRSCQASAVTPCSCACLKC